MRESAAQVCGMVHDALASSGMSNESKPLHVECFLLIGGLD